MINPFAIPTTEAQLPTLKHAYVDLDQLRQTIDHNQTQLHHLLNDMDQANDQDTIAWQYMQRLEAIEADVSECWQPMDYLQSVAQTPEQQKAYETGLEWVTQWQTEVSQNQRIYRWLKYVKAHPKFAVLNQEQQATIHDQLRQYQLAGTSLPDAEKARYQLLTVGLAQDGARFERNVVDSSREKAILIDQKEELKGLPEALIDVARETAKKQGKTGWLLTINGPMMQAVMPTATYQPLRKALYTAWVTRASENTRFDNSQVMYDILLKRHQLSQLTQFNNYAERSLAHDKMAETPEAVVTFLNQLVQSAAPKAKEEYEQLKNFAKEKGHQGEFYPWDVKYFSEKLAQEKFGIQQEELRAYFPLPHVLKELINLLEDLFSLKIEIVATDKVWDPAVKLLAIKDQQDQLKGYLYLDLYHRSNKRPGAWVHPYTQRRVDQEGILHLPIAFLTCNFQSPHNAEPSLLRHVDVCTLFHEMGHALHHVLTTVDCGTVSGMAGVPWDAVEFPSQLLEQLPWEPAILCRLSAHYLTQAPLPIEKVNALKASNTFHASLKLMKQLEFGLFDFTLHQLFNPEYGIEQIQHVLDATRRQTGLSPEPDFDRFQHGFAHIFSGGYGAGYYSYLWAEVLAIDAFSRFQEEALPNGLFNPKTGHDFVIHVLEKGGSDHMLRLFKAFRGRSPNTEALLHHYGVLA